MTTKPDLSAIHERKPRIDLNDKSVVCRDRIQFGVWAARTLILADSSRTLRAEKALPMAGQIVLEFLADCHIEYGDHRYSWTRADAETIAHEYGIDHWEKAA